MGARYSREELKKTVGNSGDFVPQSHFAVEIAGLVQNGVTKVEGPKFELATINYKHAEQNHMSVRPGLMQPGRLNLTRQYFGKNREFRDWMNKCLAGQHDRRTVTVHYKNESGKDVKRVDLYNCYATAYKPPNLNTLSSGNAKETITIVFEEGKVLV
jgi:phage tail-like protein